VSETLTIELHNRAQAWAAIKSQLFPFLAQVLQARKRLVLTVGPRKRTKPQNARYWGKGVLAQVAEQAAPGGQLFPAEVWHEEFKRRFIGVVELPCGGVIGMSSADLDTAAFSIFCHQVEAYAATELGVTFYDLEPA
jgi:hypothetical protein